MGKIKSNGLDYFSFDVDAFDDPKMIEMKMKHGTIFESVFIRLLQMIYREGYYIESNIETVSYIITDKIGGQFITKDEVETILTDCIKTGLLDRTLSEEGVFTSTGIQKRYALAMQRRTYFGIPRFWLLEDVTLNISKSAQMVQLTIQNCTKGSVKYKNCADIEQKKELTNQNCTDGSVNWVQTKTETETKTKNKTNTETKFFDSVLSDDIQSSFSVFSDSIIEALKKEDVTISRNTLQWIDESLKKFDRRSIEEALETAIEKKRAGDVRSVVGYAKTLLNNWSNGKGSPKWVEDREREIADEKSEHLQPSKISAQILKRI